MRCAVLHETAALERDLFGEVVSESVAAHMDGCDWVAPPPIRADPSLMEWSPR